MKYWQGNVLNFSIQKLPRKITSLENSRLKEKQAELSKLNDLIAICIGFFPWCNFQRWDILEENKKGKFSKGLLISFQFCQYKMSSFFFSFFFNLCKKCLENFEFQFINLLKIVWIFFSMLIPEIINLKILGKFYSVVCKFDRCFLRICCIGFQLFL